MCISDHLTWDRREDLEMDEIEAIWLEIKPKMLRGFLVAIGYRLPDTSKYLSKDFDDLLSKMLTRASDESKDVIFLGDMNANYLVPEDNKKFKSVFDIFGFKQTILKPTRLTTTSKTLINVILTNNPPNLMMHQIEFHRGLGIMK